MEIWKDIKEFEGFYQISNYGRVKSLEKKVRFVHCLTKNEHFKLNKEIILKGSSCKGYNIIHLSKYNINLTKRICRLVAIHFIDNPENKPQVNHIDGNKKNDNVSNLEWNTPKENVEHAFKNNLIKRGKGKDCKLSMKVKCLLTNKVFDTINDFAKYKNIDASNISRALSGKYKNNHNVEYYNL